LLILPIDKLLRVWYNGNSGHTGAWPARQKSHPKNWDGSVLGSVPKTATALLPLATALGLGACGGGVVVASLSATACAQKLGVEIIVAHITRAVRGVTETHRTVTIHHF